MCGVPISPTALMAYALSRLSHGFAGGLCHRNPGNLVPAMNDPQLSRRVMTTSGISSTRTSN